MPASPSARRTSSSTWPAESASTSPEPTSPSRSRSRRPPERRRSATASPPSARSGSRWMQTEGKTKRDERPTSGLGFTRSPSEDDPRRDARLLDALARIAPGTDLRAGIDDIIRSREGALIVIGDPAALSFLYSGGIRLDQPFTPQLLYELAKMDGAIIVNADVSRLVYANVQLMPDPTIPSSETGTRHRTAERVAKQTGALVVSISQQRETVTLFAAQARYVLDAVSEVLAKTNQALATLETYAQRLDQVLTRLTALEFQNAVVLD